MTIFKYNNNTGGITGLKTVIIFGHMFCLTPKWKRDIRDMTKELRYTQRQIEILDCQNEELRRELYRLKRMTEGCVNYNDRLQIVHHIIPDDTTKDDFTVRVHQRSYFTITKDD